MNHDTSPPPELPEHTDPQPRHETAREWVQRWKELGPLLEEQRERDIRATDTLDAVAVLADSMTFIKKCRPLRQDSGLEDLQRWFLQARAREAHHA